MAVRRSIPDHQRPDLVLQAAYERIAGLRAGAHASRAAAPSGSGRGVVAGWRDALGRRLIAAGTALVTDETVRRRPALRP